MYRLIHFLLTGVQVQVGNFSVIPATVLRRLVAVSELWNHYAAAVYKAKLPMALIPAQRNCRLEGSSRMNLVALVVHGLSAMAVFGDRIGVRLLMVVSSGMSLVSHSINQRYRYPIFNDPRHTRVGYLRHRDFAGDPASDAHDSACLCVCNSHRA